MKEFYLKHKEGLLYLLFGVFVTLSNWLVYSLLVWFTGIGVTMSNAVAWLVAVITAFVTN